MRIGLTGDWAAARRLLEALGTRAAAAMHRAVLQEAHAIRGQIVQGLVAQAPAGAPFKPLAALTVAARQLAGFGGTKALLRRGDLLGSITVVTSGGDVFIGVARTARAADGRALTDVAHAHEYGTAPTVIPITPKMRRFLHVLFRASGRPMASRGRGTGVVVVQIPPRPFLRPVFDQAKPGMSQRVLARACQLLSQEASA
jgi:hypothetical protein